MTDTPPTRTPFLDRVICYLMPYFLSMAPDVPTARANILETLAAYGTRTRAELLIAVRIIAFSMSALDTLAEAKLNNDFAPTLRLRFATCANNLNRSARWAETTLAARLKCDLPDTVPPESRHAESLQAESPQSEPINDLPELQTEDILRQIDAEIHAHRNRIHQDRMARSPVGHPPPDSPKHAKAGQMFNALFEAQQRPSAAA